MPTCSYSVLENNVSVSLIKFLFYIKRQNGACTGLDHKRKETECSEELQVYKKKSLSDFNE